jgi:hypothetical protein
MTVSSFPGFNIGRFPPKCRPLGIDVEYLDKSALVSFLEQNIRYKRRKLQFCGLNTRRYVWLVSRYLGLSEVDTLKSWTLMTGLVSVVSFALILVLNFFVA